MKNFISLSFITFFSIVTTVFIPQLANAQATSEANPSKCIREPQPYIAPETLASMAYQGYLEKQGIPGYGVFESEFGSGNINAQKVVQAAVAGCLLSDQYGVATHKNYIQEVQEQLEFMIQGNSGR
ncbi:hypothetical protein [Chroococcus sp. FPU101]|uniref:hypothetical protein n=1 Tax=Chroococcus sp. FPU101 TaxID=1974212 RepID=UPI001A8F77F6|nr:hypothetical protein [Chroococcus sp. FPU101]GFE70898.1 hypothetical protein CFPU101_35080 [Chroococcus sp. FPU101]